MQEGKSIEELAKGNDEIIQALKPTQTSDDLPQPFVDLLSMHLHNRGNKESASLKQVTQLWDILKYLILKIESVQS